MREFNYAPLVLACLFSLVSELSSQTLAVRTVFNDRVATVQREVGLLMEAGDLPSLDRIAARWRAELPEKEQKAILLQLVRNLAEDKKLAKKVKDDGMKHETPKSPRHDLMTVKGRSAWAIERLLWTDLLIGVTEPGRQSDAYETIIAEMKLPHEPDPGLPKLNFKERRILAAAPKTSEPVLSWLAYDPDRQVRLEVARNKSSHDRTLSILAEDPDPEVRRAAFNILFRVPLVEPKAKSPQ